MAATSRSPAISHRSSCPLSRSTGLRSACLHRVSPSPMSGDISRTLTDIRWQLRRLRYVELQDPRPLGIAELLVDGVEGVKLEDRDLPMSCQVLDDGRQFEGDDTVGPDDAGFQGVIGEPLTVMLDARHWIPAVCAPSRPLRKTLDGKTYDGARRHHAELLQVDRDAAPAGVRDRRD